MKLYLERFPLFSSESSWTVLSVPVSVSVQFERGLATKGLGQERRPEWQGEAGLKHYVSLWLSPAGCQSRSPYPP